MSKLRISFNIPQAMQQELREQVIKDGYGLRGKSRWVIDSIEQLLKLPGFVEFVRDADDMNGFDVLETISVDRNIKKVLDDTVAQVRNKFPMMEGVQSRILRASIIQQLLRNLDSQSL